MKKKLYIMMIAAMSLGLVACGKVNEESVDNEITTQLEAEPVSEGEDEIDAEVPADVAKDIEDQISIANPWTASDEEGILDATGFAMKAPDGSTDVIYSYMAESNMAQVTYKYEGNDWVYRIQPTDSLTDISGMNYEYDLRMPGTVAGNEAEYLAYADPSADSEYIDALYGIHIVNWYDSTKGATYSLSAAGYNTNGMDIQVYAEQLYAPAEDNASDTVASETFSDGLYDSSLEGSGFTVEKKADGTYKTELTVLRLCYLENGVGTVYETIDGDEMTVSAIDPNGNDISYVIYQKDDGIYEVKFIESTWEYLPEGTILTGYIKQ